MSVSLVQILTPLGAASHPPPFVPVLAFDLGEPPCRVLGRRPGREFPRWPSDGVVAVSHVRR